MHCGTYQPEVASHWTFSAIAGRDIDLSVADLPYNILKTGTCISSKIH